MNITLRLLDIDTCGANAAILKIIGSVAKWAGESRGVIVDRSEKNDLGVRIESIDVKINHFHVRKYDLLFTIFVNSRSGDRILLERVVHTYKVSESKPADEAGAIAAIQKKIMKVPGVTHRNS